MYFIYYEHSRFIKILKPLTLSVHAHLVQTTPQFLFIYLSKMCVSFFSRLTEDQRGIGNRVFHSITPVSETFYQAVRFEFSFIKLLPCVSFEKCMSEVNR